MITVKGYTFNELEYITQNYHNKTIKQLSADLNKSYNSISNAVRKLGLLKQPHGLWRDEEVEYIRNHYLEMTSEELAEKLKRNVNSINSKKSELGLAKLNKWTSEEEQFLIDNFDKMTHKEIGKKLDRSDSSVRAKCFDLNLYKKEQPWTDDELKYLKDNYMEMPISDISSILRRSVDAVHLKASRMGLKKYPYTCDYHYFDEIDTEEKAYWLGFLSADGWISMNKEANAGVTGIELQYGDYRHLKKFNKSIGGNYQITDRWRPCPISTKDPEKKHHMCLIRIFSLTMYHTLRKLGFSENKTYDFFMPKIKDDLKRHYIRGYYDGDGCLSLTNKTFSVSFISASNSFFSDLICEIRKQGLTINERSFTNQCNTLMYYASIDKTKDKLKFLDWIYKDSNIYLDRKYKKYLKAKEKYSDLTGPTN